MKFNMRRRSCLWSATALLSLALLMSIRTMDVRAADNQDLPLASSSTDGQGHGTYENVGRFGAGLSWAPIQIAPGATTETSVGYIGARYWFNRTFGVDGGFGLGWPEVSPNGLFLLTLHAEPMIAILETQRTVVYGNIDLMPAIEAGTGSSWALQLSAGVGIEHALEDLPRLALYGQWNPLSLDFYGPGDGQSTSTGLGLLGSVVNFDLGFRYYF